ncbi:MAG: NAD kinase [Acidiferrobacteraceae bacterium]|nr:NAD kinase [Acidiferrobacteraceae bacterium]MDP6434370.1 NAD(+)/NADH kinase [Arenicellales bacterium]MDP6672668.1 NAD(+)/NADH kinase [Arenicellales bacterium]MDP6725334.1 NAD(+)/NADH kinase [Arenicellales bacterium]|tara:strand:- start:664 stop:1521 length:858 start_codon:yes stop_codon:yes gene_type:complete
MPDHFKTIGLYGRLNDPSQQETLQRLQQYLHELGRTVFVSDAVFHGPELKDQGDPLPDLAVAVGGDGSMMLVARSMAASQTPVLGINLGRLGFLTDLEADSMVEDFNRILAGEFWIENRTMLALEVERSEELIHSSSVLNDVVINKGETARLIEFEMMVDDDFVTRYRGDGLIVATPTGSTAYSLSAGGPILLPTLPAINVVPICPHTLSNRPLVIDDQRLISIIMLHAEVDSARVSVDGFNVVTLDGSEKITIKRAQSSVKLLRVSGHSHYEVLRSKLGWGGRL